MDQFMVDVTAIEDVEFGDKVVIFGRDGKEFLSVDTLGELSGRFNYEFVCVLNKRIPREYIRHGEVVEQVDSFYLPCIRTEAAVGRFCRYRKTLQNTSEKKGNT